MHFKVMIYKHKRGSTQLFDTERTMFYLIVAAAAA